jgi:hypothetical protein
MNDLVKKPDNYTARYEAIDPFASFANEGGAGIVGKLLSCKKGTWGIGQDETAPPSGARYLALMDSMMRGWLRWWGGVVTAADVGRVADNFLVKHRFALGEMDEAEWEKNPDGRPRDPWGKTYRMLLVECAAPHGDLTFSSGSFGAELAFRELAGTYAVGREQHPGACPVVELSTDTWTSKSYGKQVRPAFPVVGWATLDDVKAGRKVLAAPAKPKTKVKAKPKPVKTLAAEIDDELPTWGK